MQNPDPTPEFAFAKEMPKAEKSRWAKFWEVFEEMKSLQTKEGMLIPLSLAAELASLSRQRLEQVALDGRLNKVSFRGHPYITENSLVDFLKMERGPGIRGPRVAGQAPPRGMVGQFNLARKMGKRILAARAAK